MPAQFATIEQIITAGNDWDGTEPTTDPVTANGIKSFPTHTAGGLFTFEFAQNVTLWEVQRIWVNFGGVAVKSVSIRRPRTPTPVDIPIFSSNLAAEEVFLLTDPIIMTQDEQLVILSTSAAAEMMARVTARPKMTLTEF